MLLGLSRQLFSPLGLRGGPLHHCGSSVTRGFFAGGSAPLELEATGNAEFHFAA